MARLFLLIIVLAAALTVQGQQQNVRLESVELDKSTLYLTCAPGRRAAEGKCNDSLEVRVSVKTSGAGAAKAKLSTIVTGGRAVVSGSGEIRWDLSGVYPGTYTITVNAEGRDGRLGESKTSTISVMECPYCNTGDACPNVRLLTPEGLVQPGENFKVDAVAAGIQEGTTYNWTLSAGTIAAGQGTPSITVDTSGLHGGSSVTISLDVSIPAGFPACRTSFTETVSLATVAEPVLFDQSPTVLPCEDGNARLDSFFVELSNNPTDRGVMVMYDSPKASRAGWRREQLIRNFARFRRFDLSRVTFVRGGFRSDAVTQFWRVPPGAADPEVLPADAGSPPPRPAPTKPYLYAAEYTDGLPECSVPMYDLEAYAAVLNTEPRSRGRLVIGESSRAKFARKRREVAAELARHGVPAGRLVFVYKAVRPNRAAEMTELWVIPSTKW